MPTIECFIPQYPWSHSQFYSSSKCVVIYDARSMCIYVNAIKKNLVIMTNLSALNRPNVNEISNDIFFSPCKLHLSTWWALTFEPRYNTLYTYLMQFHSTLAYKWSIFANVFALTYIQLSNWISYTHFCTRNNKNSESESNNNIYSLVWVQYGEKKNNSQDNVKKKLGEIWVYLLLE